MRLSLPLCVASSAILATSPSVSGAENQLNQPDSDSVELSSEDFNALLEAAKSLPINSLSPDLGQAVQDWTMIAYGAEKISGTGSPAIEATIFFEPSEDFGPVIKCTSSADKIEWTHCEEASIRLGKGCTQ